MISDKDMRAINPKQPTVVFSSDHVQAGLPIPKPMRIKTLSAGEWEEFILECAVALGPANKVRRHGGPNDKGVDIAVFHTPEGFRGAWDNYQCKQYNRPLRPSDIWIEIGKIIYYSYIGEYAPPEKCYFVASLDMGILLESLLNKPEDLRAEFKKNWNGYCRERISTTRVIEMDEELLAYVDSFNFLIFSSKSHVELIDLHSRTGFHAVRFGGGLPPRPDVEPPPDMPTENESRYIRQLFDAYSDYLNIPINDLATLEPHQRLVKNYLRQRVRFYYAESLRNFARDIVPEGTFEKLQEEIYNGVIDVVDGDYENGLEKMRNTLLQAANISTTSNPLASATEVQDKQGICHQLANSDRLIWVKQ
ncbi:MAG: hypothetical protein OXF24_06925 [Hyphomicrobiales bacterium]|nr:hypothetical protein [Hyphomicrobiales bacterium]